MRRYVTRAALLLCTLVGLVGAPAARAASPPASVPPPPANSRGPLLWTDPANIDVNPIDAITCPTASLCVAADRGGGVLWSGNPAAGARSWHRADVAGRTEITGLSCPSARECVAVDAGGNLITTRNPTGGAAAWTRTKLDSSKTQQATDTTGAVLLRGVACPATNECVAVDGVGNLLGSNNPLGGVAAWTISHMDMDLTYGCTGTGLTCQPPLTAVACPSTSSCVAADFAGNVFTSSQPTAQLPWTSTPTAGGALSSLFGLSCPTTGFCAAVNGSADQVITLNPANPTARRVHTLAAATNGIWCASASLCLASVQTHGAIAALAGSVNPAASSPTWTLMSPGGVDGAACPSTGLCIAVDDEGNVVNGETVTAIGTTLRSRLLSSRGLPNTAVLASVGHRALPFPNPLAGTVTLEWTRPGAGGAPELLASGTRTFAGAQTGPVTITLTAAARALFGAASGRVTVTARAILTTATGSVVESRRLTFAPPPKHRPGPH